MSSKHTRPDLTPEAKQAFQIVSLLATILVVGIHYKSDIPDSPQFLDATWNELAQEYLFGGLARVAVPLFAFAAGLFYFRSDDGTGTTYLQKLRQRSRTVLIPYLLIGLVATLVWHLLKVAQSEPVGHGAVGFIQMWLLHPPSEQMWFLRDLMVLVVAAPLIRWAVHSPIRWVVLPLTFLAWVFNLQFTPVIQGWYLLSLETMFFFMLGCAAVRKFAWLEALGNVSSRTMTAVLIFWSGMVAIRVWVRPDFDIWYTNEWGLADLLIHQASILIGCMAVWMVAWRMRFSSLLFLSGASFFVYLTHEYPARAIVERIGEKLVAPELVCWLATPVAIVGCYAMAVALFRWLPGMTSVLTGGRGPQLADTRKAAKAKRSQSSRQPAC